MKTIVSQIPWQEVEADVIVAPLFLDDSWDDGLSGRISNALAGLPASLGEGGEWRPRPGENLLLYHQAGVAAARVLLVGCGSRQGTSAARVGNLTLQALAEIAGSGPCRVAVCHHDALSIDRAAQAAAESVVLSSFDPGEYKTTGNSRGQVEELIFVTAQESDKIEAALRRGRIVAEATNLTRELVNRPGNEVGPQDLARRAREVAERCGLAIEVLDETEMAAMGMNAVLAVARGSDEPASFIRLHHRGGESDHRPVVLVGKGVTFDTGGISLKPPQSMEEMKADKAGACAVLGAMNAIARLQLPVNVTALLPCVENMPSGRAQRPGDVIRSMSGKTIEVINTDAEGRLILADALTMACRDLKARWIVDIATLTGACIVALGHVRAGLFTNDDGLGKRVSRAAEDAGEGVWRLPLDDDYRSDLDSDVADLKNVGPRWGGAVTAAKFLEAFVDETPWCHIDMAGVDAFTDDKEVAGPTGFGVRTLVNLVADEALRRRSD